MPTPSATATLEVLGQSVPAIGFGTWQLTGEDCEQGVADALAVGYRHIDTAQMYENEAEVGLAIASAGVDRAELFITTKLTHDNLDRERVAESTGESLRKLRTEYVDLLLIHWPSENIPLSETLIAMDELRQAGKVRRIGVSNFPPSMLRQARQFTEIFCNQVEYHPFLAQPKLLEAVRDEGLMLTAYCPLARGRVLSDETIRAIGDGHGKSPAQVTLRWLVQQGVAAIPKASSARHRGENIDIFDFELSDEEMVRISALGGEGRLIDPEWGPKWERG